MRRGCAACVLQDELTEKAELQEALIKSEELRLGLAKTLIDTQVGRGWGCWGWRLGTYTCIFPVRLAACTNTDVVLSVA